MRRRRTPKQFYILAVTRGKTTRLYYGIKTLKDALALGKLKPGDTFVFAKYIGSDETKAVWEGNGVYSVARVTR